MSCSHTKRPHIKHGVHTCIVICQRALVTTHAPAMAQLTMRRIVMAKVYGDPAKATKPCIRDHRPCSFYDASLQRRFQRTFHDSHNQTPQVMPLTLSCGDATGAHVRSYFAFGYISPTRGPRQPWTAYSVRKRSDRRSDLAVYLQLGQAFHAQHRLLAALLDQTCHP